MDHIPKIGCEYYRRVMMGTPSLKGRARTSTLESWRTYSLNSLMASAISSFTPPE